MHALLKNLSYQKPNKWVQNSALFPSLVTGENETHAARELYHSFLRIVHHLPHIFKIFFFFFFLVQRTPEHWRVRELATKFLILSNFIFLILLNSSVGPYLAPSIYIKVINII